MSEGGALFVGELGFEDLLVPLNIRNNDLNSLSVINFGLPDEFLDLLEFVLSSLIGLRIEVSLRAEVSLIVLDLSGSSLKSPVCVR